MKASLILIAMSFGAIAQTTWSEKALTDKDLIERGRHLVKITGCNDCHTPMFAEKDGNVPEKEWLVGVPVGFKGPWGTSYPTNLRLMVRSFKEQPFISYVKGKRYLPPMPGFNIRAMTDDELKAIYAFITHLGPAGEKAPQNLPPTRQPSGPYINFVPKVD